MTARRKRRTPQVPADAPTAGEALPAPAPETLPVPADAPIDGEAMLVPMSWSPPPEVHDAAARICSLFDTALAVAASIEAQMMEALHEIRRACPDEEMFKTVVAEMTPLRPAEAVRMVETWDVARRQRDLRELAQNRPREAMNLVRAFTDAGAGDAEVTAFTADDAEVAAVLALPPRKRNARIREMVRREQDGAGGHHPADREAIRALTEECDALAGQVEAQRRTPAALAAAPLARLRAVRAALNDALEPLSAVIQDVAQCFDDLDPAALSAAAQDEAGRIIYAAERVTDELETVMHRAMVLAGDEAPL